MNEKAIRSLRNKLLPVNRQLSIHLNVYKYIRSHVFLSVGDDWKIPSYNFTCLLAMIYVELNTILQVIQYG
jgi:hypothetical protein